MAAWPATPGAPSHLGTGSSHVLSFRACSARYFYAGSAFGTAGFRYDLRPLETAHGLHIRSGRWQTVAGTATGLLFPVSVFQLSPGDQRQFSGHFSYRCRPLVYQREAVWYAATPSAGRTDPALCPMNKTCTAPVPATPADCSPSSKNSGPQIPPSGCPAET